MTGSEKMVEATFGEYKTARLATLMILFPKMRPAGRLGKMVAYVPVAKAPYDVAGYFHKTGRHIALEIKENSDQHTSVAIIGPGKKGTGLQYHQLEALVEVHEQGGLALLLWDNAGDWGIIDGVRLKIAKATYDQSLKAEAKGYPNAKGGGVRSIRRELFTPVKVDDQGRPLWLPADVKKTGLEAVLTKAIAGAAAASSTPLAAAMDATVIDGPDEENLTDEVVDPIWGGAVDRGAEG